MSLRLTSYIVPKPLRGAASRKTAIFRVKSHLAWKSTMHFPVSLRWIVCIDSKSPKVDSEMQSVQNLNNNLR